PPSAPLNELALATHRAFFDALRAHDVAALSSLYSVDAVIDVGVGAARASKPDAIGALATALWIAFPDSRVQWGLLLQSGNALAVDLAWTGTHTGPLGGLNATKKLVGTHALLLERFDAAGHIASQHLYLDTVTVLTDLAARGARPHAFDGLPTRQTTVLDATSPPAEDDAAMKGLVTAFRQGSFLDVRPLGADTTTWTDATKGRTVRGKGALQAWASFLEHTYGTRGTRDEAATRLVDAWSSGAWQVLEWNRAAGRDGVAAQAAELVRFEGGHVAEVRTYRAPSPERPSAR
ncbi:MAG: ester cyclase, partial [Polyangiaceae bacterium]